MIAMASCRVVQVTGIISLESVSTPASRTIAFSEDPSLRVKSRRFCLLPRKGVN